MVSSTKEYVKKGKFVDTQKYRPVGDRVLVRRDAKPGESPGGIILPEQAKQKPSTGTVLAIGPGKLLDTGERQPPELRVGEKVYFARWSGAEVPEDDTLVFVRAEDIFAGEPQE